MTGYLISSQLIGYMPDENHASASSAPPRRSFWQRRVDAFFGYDFFISYAWADGKTYAHDLAQRLTRRGFECFLDNEGGFLLGDDLNVIGRWALKRTSKLVLVGTPRALQSEPVLLELQVFTSGGKRIIPIDFDGSLATEKNPDNPVLKLIGPTKLKVGERAERLNDGPSDTTMKEIIATFNQTRQSVKRRRWLQGFVILLAVLLGVAIWQTVVAKIQQKKAEESAQEANRQRVIAEDRLEQARRSLYALQLFRVAKMNRKDSGVAVKMLEDLQRCPLDLREFTWGYYRQLFGSQDPPQKVLDESGGAFRAIALSPIGRTIAIPALNGIQLRNLESGEKHVIPGLAGEIVSLAYSPDGKSLAVVTNTIDETAAWLVDVRSAKVTRLRQGSVSFAKFSHDGNTIALASDGQLLLWDVAKSELRTLFQPPLRGFISALAFSPDDGTIATGGSDRMVRLWDVATGNKKRELKGHTATIIGLWFSAGGNMLNSVSEKNPLFDLQKQEVIAWNLESGAQEVVFQTETDVPVITALSISPDGRTVATGHQDGTVALRDPQTWESRATLHADGAPVLTLEFSNEGERLACGTGRDTHSRDRGVVNVWDAYDWKKNAVLPGLKGMIYSLAFTGTGLVSASGYDNGEIVAPGEAILWDTITGSHRSLFFGPADNAVYAAAISPDGKRIALATHNALHLLQPDTGVDRLLPKSGSTDFTQIAFSADGKVIAWSPGDAWWDKQKSPVILLDANAGRQIGALAAGGPLAFSPDGKTLATVNHERNSVVLWDYQSGNLRCILPGHSGPIYCLAFSPTGTTLATGSQDKSVTIWDCSSGEELARLPGHSDHVRAVEFSPDGKRLVAGVGSTRTSPGEFKLWDLENRIVIKTVRESTGPVLAVAFSPDGKLLATAGRSSEGPGFAGEVRLWRVAALQQVPQE